MLIYARYLVDGDIAIGCFNLSGDKGMARLNLDELGLPFSTGKTLKLKELWTGEETPVMNGVMMKELEAFDCAVYRGKVVDL